MIGSSRSPRAKKKSEERQGLERKEKEFGIKILFSPARKRKMRSPSPLVRGKTGTDCTRLLYAVPTRREKPFLVIGFLVMTCSQFESPPHIV
jgi:hypothetical protein